jgi:NAD(P)-dependent dehydrogenase (short-subunit alcohol dehydrogenase family)
MAKILRSLNGQVVAITGGARGIGRATAAALIAQGARVGIGDIDAPLAERTAIDLNPAHPGATIGLPLDVTDRESFTAFLDEVERQLGPLDVLVNNAGIMPIGPFIEETDAAAARLIDINLTGVILGSKLAIERFTPRHRGHIVQLASIAGKGGFPGGATYCATKHAVVGLTEAIRAELRGSGSQIEVHQVLPIGVNTELYSGVKQARGFKTPEPDDVADAIVELLQTGRFEQYVPRYMAAVVRMNALMPRRFTEAINRITNADRLLLSADPSARAAYDARMAQMFDGPAVPVAVPDEPARDAA